MQDTGWFSDVKLDDRRAKPSHGYRAVHLITKVAAKPVEIQVRTELQDGWLRSPRNSPTAVCRPRGLGSSWRYYLGKQARRC